MSAHESPTERLLAPRTLAPAVSSILSTNEDEVSLFGIVALLLRHWRLFVTIPLLALAAAVAYSFTHPRAEARSSFVPQSSSASASRLLGIAAQLGVALPGSSPESSPEFYRSLLLSRDILDQAAHTRYSFHTDAVDGAARTGTIPELFDLEGKTPTEQRLAAIKWMESHATVGVEAKTGIVRLTVTARWPELAEQLNRRLLVLVSDFNKASRRTAARAEREFLEAQLENASAEVRRAETRLESFLAQNRSYQAAPRLVAEASRLEREVSLRRELRDGLARAYDQSRIEEVRQTPVTTIVEAPEGSALRRRYLLRNGILGIAAGVLIALVLVSARRFWHVQASARPEELAAVRQELKRAMRGVPGWVPIPRRWRMTGSTSFD